MANAGFGCRAAPSDLLRATNCGSSERLPHAKYLPHFHLAPANVARVSAPVPDRGRSRRYPVRKSRRHVIVEPTHEQARRARLDSVQETCRFFPAHYRSVAYRLRSAKQTVQAQPHRISIFAFLRVEGRFQLLLLPTPRALNRGGRRPAVRRVSLVSCRTTAAYRLLSR